MLPTAQIACSWISWIFESINEMIFSTPPLITIDCVLSDVPLAMLVRHQSASKRNSGKLWSRYLMNS
jgi:hypothetical protein